MGLVTNTTVNGNGKENPLHCSQWVTMNADTDSAPDESVKVIQGRVTHGTLYTFDFKHFGLNYLTLAAGNQQYPTLHLTPDFDGNHAKYIEAFHLLYQAANLHNSNSGLIINHDNYPAGYTIYGFDLTTDMCEGAHIDPIKYGTLRLETHFNTPLAQAINIVHSTSYPQLSTAKLAFLQLTIETPLSLKKG